MSENLAGNFYMETPIKFEPEQNTTEPEHHLLVRLVRESIMTSLTTFGKLSDGDEISSAAVNFLNQVRKSKLDEEVDVQHLTSRCRFPLYDSDFGWGKPCLVTCVCMPVEFTALMDTKCGTGIEAWVGLDEPRMLEFEKDPDISGLATSSCSTDGKIIS